MLMLLENGYSVVIMDNLRNSFPKAYEHMQRIAGPELSAKMKFVKVSVCVSFSQDGSWGVVFEHRAACVSVGGCCSLRFLASSLFRAHPFSPPSLSLPHSTCLNTHNTG